MPSKKIEYIKFDADDIENDLAKLSQEELDQLSFGAVLLDPEGYVVFYNASEGRLSGRKPRDQVGKHFFRDVAPCTQSDAFFGRFQKLIEGQIESAIFEYLFDFRVAPTRVLVHMKPASDPERYWVLVRRA